MRITKYLVINSKGKTRLLERTKSNYRGNLLKPNEIAIKINVEVPDKLFQRPQLEASVVISPEIKFPDIIKADTLVNAENAIKQVTGLDLKINVVVPNDMPKM
jgi:hypothetical protein